VHSIVDDCSRLAYSEIHPDETAATVTAFTRRALSPRASFQHELHDRSRGDDGQSCLVSARLGLGHGRTVPSRARR
jgi:hypothetical protein